MEISAWILVRRIKGLEVSDAFCLITYGSTCLYGSVDGGTRKVLINVILWCFKGTTWDLVTLPGALPIVGLVARTTTTKSTQSAFWAHFTDPSTPPLAPGQSMTDHRSLHWANACQRFTLVLTRFFYPSSISLLVPPSTISTRPYQLCGWTQQPLPQTNLAEEIFRCATDFSLGCLISRYI